MKLVGLTDAIWIEFIKYSWPLKQISPASFSVEHSPNPKWSGLPMTPQGQGAGPSTKNLLFSKSAQLWSELTWRRKGSWAPIEQGLLVLKIKTHNKNKTSSRPTEVPVRSEIWIYELFTLLFLNTFLGMIFLVLKWFLDANTCFLVMNKTTIKILCIVYS